MRKFGSVVIATAAVHIDTGNGRKGDEKEKD
jgi:hypothetical protein